MNWLMATVTPPSGEREFAEAEPVLVDDDGHTIRLVLDDGTTLEFDHSELLGELAPALRRAA